MTLPAAILRKASTFLSEVAEKPVPAPEEVMLRAATAKLYAEKLAPRRRVKKVLPFRTTAERKEKKRLTRKGAVELVRPQVEARAGGICECGCGQPFEKTIQGCATWDEFYGRKHVTEQETWMLRADCHQRKTENDPAREEWDDKFRAHCARHGYPFRKRFYREPMRRRVT